MTIPTTPTALQAKAALFIDHDQAFITSRAVAEHFGKKHKDVLKAIRNLLADCPEPEVATAHFCAAVNASTERRSAPSGLEFGGRNFTPADSPDQGSTEPNFGFSGLNFQPAKFLDAQKKPRIEYNLSHSGFALLVMGFTGKKALAWKIAFLAAFDDLEAELRAALEREAIALYTLRPHWKEIGEGTAAGLSRADICQLTGHKSHNTITANRRRMRDIGLLN